MNLVFEFLAVDGASTSTSAGGITGLNHEVGDDTVEDDVVVVTSLRKSHEVFASLIIRIVSVREKIQRELRGEHTLGA